MKTKFKWPYTTIKELRERVEKLEQDKENFKDTNDIFFKKMQQQAGEILEKDKVIADLNSEIIKKEQDFKRTVEFMRLESLGK